MYIAICDDDLDSINLVQKFVKEIKRKYSDAALDIFTSGEELLKVYDTDIDKYDIVILDIEMEEISGVVVANKIRKLNNTTAIFFLSSHTEYAIECFHAQPTDFWVKPLDYDRFQKGITKARNQLTIARTVLEIVEKRSAVRIKYADILYLEYKDRKTCVHTLNGIHITNESLTDVIGNLKNDQFVRVHNSFAVNLEQVYIIDHNFITLYDTREKIPIGRSYRKDVKKKYMQFRRRESS